MHIEDLVSVIFPVYNERIDYLDASIRSILEQSYDKIELIIIDDSDQADVIQHLKQVSAKDTRIVYLHNASRLGMVKSLNKGLEAASGKYIARADSDDIQHHQRIEKQIEFLMANPAVGIIGASIWKIDQTGRRIGVRHYPTGNKLLRQMMIRNAIAHPTVLIRNCIIDSIGSYDESFKKAEDYEFWMRSMKRGIKISNLSEPLVQYRLPTVAKRDSINWINNLRVKIRYFDRDYTMYRILGIFAVSSMIMMPSFLRRLLYRFYNRLI